jgi:hypothetical protein
MLAGVYSTFTSSIWVSFLMLNFNFRRGIVPWPGELSLLLSLLLRLLLFLLPLIFGSGLAADDKSIFEMSNLYVSLTFFLFGLAALNLIVFFLLITEGLSKS